MADATKLQHITLPTRPSCNDCLSWSEDNLAVAGGEFVHILTPKTFADRAAPSGHPQWQLSSLRTNVFQQSEWPEQIPTTIQQFSIGEEISNSHVVALTWTQPGLGIHRRSVLAVLTSNLILSLWETDGGQAQYQRTCVINGHLAQNGASQDAESDRRTARIRSFAWLPSLKTFASPKWGLHYLVVADDRGGFTFSRVSKTKTTSLGSWSIQTELKIDLDDLDIISTDHTFMSPLQRRLSLQAPITKIEATPWHKLKLSQELIEANTKEAYVSQLSFKQGPNVHTTSLYALVSTDGQRISLCAPKGLQSNVSYEQSMKLDGHKDSSKNVSPPADYFKEATQPFRDNFDTTFHLLGHYRMRFWGSALSSDGSQAVACITLHPSDMIEYTIPSAEKCTLVFRTTRQTGPQEQSACELPAPIYEKILAFGREALVSGKSVESPIDQQLLRTLVSLAGIVLDPASELRTSLEDFHDAMLARTAIEPANHGVRDAQASRVSLYRHLSPET